MSKCGFDSPQFLDCIDEKNLDDLEKYVDQDRTILENPNLKCQHISIYVNQSKFSFLPMHRIILLNWSSHFTNSKESDQNLINIEHPAFSPILRAMIRTALSNYDKYPHNNRFPELLFDFSIYLYIMSGRACYETISANLPLPKAGTVGEEYLFLLFFMSKINVLFVLAGKTSEKSQYIK